jgi:hypothetical protein
MALWTKSGCVKSIFPRSQTTNKLAHYHQQPSFPPLSSLFVQILKKGGMSVGDQIILTKAVGTGTLFAAEMRARAKGSWVDGAIKSMLRSNRLPALCLRVGLCSPLSFLALFTTAPPHLVCPLLYSSSLVLYSLLLYQHPIISVQDHGASSCTDVTGFGLLGHLIEMVKASNNESTSLAVEVRCDFIFTLFALNLICIKLAFDYSCFQIYQ